MGLQKKRISIRDVRAAYDTIAKGDLSVLERWLAYLVVYENSKKRDVLEKAQATKKLAPLTRTLDEVTEVRGMGPSELKAKNRALYGMVVTLSVSGEVIVHDLYFDRENRVIAIKSTK
jgi:hypothetical protein